MALYIKKHWSKGAKNAGAIFFAVLMFVNVKLTTGPDAKGDIDLLGLKLSLYTPSVYASGSGGYSCSVTLKCSDWVTISCTGSQSCAVYVDYVKCDGHKTYCSGDGS